jgi:hypothetical protein
MVADVDVCLLDIAVQSTMVADCNMAVVAYRTLRQHHTVVT